VTGKVFVRLDRATCPCGVVSRRKFGSATLTFATLVVACSGAAGARSGSTASIASSRRIVLVRHVDADVSKTRKVDVRPDACDRKNTPRTLMRQLRSAEIRHEVSVPQRSLI
jgi:hypothetical protein